MNNYIKEACVESIEQAVKAEQKGADRIELCSNWSLGGLTPSKSLTESVINNISIPVRVMIRPCKGDFVYSESEILQMSESIEWCKQIGVDGVVFGVLNKNHTLNTAVITQLAKTAYPLKVVIHKAIDDTPDIIFSLKQLLEIGLISTILTSGGKSTALEGALVLKEMILIADNQLEIMAQGNISPKNLKKINNIVKAHSYHGKNIVGEI